MTTQRAYEAEILAALDIESPRNSVAAVKSLVISEFEALDTRVKIKSTDYFNHTFAPDLVLSWPRDRMAERYVYLRFNDDLAYLTDGLDRMHGSEPIVFGLTPTPHDAPEEVRTLRSVATERRTLVTDPSGVSTLIAGRSDTPVLGLFSSSLAQGGRGLLDNEEALAATQTIAAGFTGARNVDADATGNAASLFSSLLDERQAGRMSRFLQAIWVGSGGRLDLFPGQHDLAGDLSDEALQFLLNFDEIADLQFWQRLGRGVSVRQLGATQVQDPSPNLGHLVQANLDHLWARACAVVADAPHLDESSDDSASRWLVERKVLAWRGEGFTAYVSETAADARSLAGKPGPGLDVDVLRGRAHDSVLNSLRLGDGRDALRLDSESDTDVAQGERLRALAQAFGAEARVHEAQATLRSGQHLDLDFRTLFAVGVTSTQPLLRDLLGTAVPLLWDLTDADTAGLTARLAVPDELAELQFDLDQRETQGILLDEDAGHGFSPA